MAAAPRRLITAPRSAAQQRILDAALELFAENGVSATSLQMIADKIGVTKAAVYHVYRAKDDIVIAVTEMQLARLEDALIHAEADVDRDRARERLIRTVIELAVDQRRMVGVLQNDPVVIRFLADHKPFQRFLKRLYAAMIGDDTGAESLVQAAMVSGAIGSAVKHPLVAGLDDDTLVENLVRMTERLVGLPADVTASPKPVAGRRKATVAAAGSRRRPAKRSVAG